MYPTPLTTGHSSCSGTRQSSVPFAERNSGEFRCARTLPARFIWQCGLSVSMLAILALGVFAGPQTPAAKAPPKGSEAEFISVMQGLQKKHHMEPMARFDSKRFIAISNAPDAFTRERLKLCELFHDTFLKHFEKAGFAVHPPTERMMIAVFATNDNFDAYFGHDMTGIAGVYHTPANRLVLYDYSENRNLRKQRDKALGVGESIGNSAARSKFESTVGRKFEDYSKDLNLSITMHECAHLVSFNCGLLARDRDVPAWLAEGMATYCEATDQGDWTRLGSSNPLRIRDLDRAKEAYISVADLVRDDRWVRSNRVLTGYGESWALFHLMITERPKDLRRYIDLIRDRKVPESRIADFQEAFGDIRKVQTRFDQCLREKVAEATPLTLR
jgi:Protein of unknown function (DUF1570)